MNYDPFLEIERVGGTCYNRCVWRGLKGGAVWNTLLHPHLTAALPAPTLLPLPAPALTHLPVIAGTVLIVIDIVVYLLLTLVWALMGTGAVEH
jgi:hypothetical protein